MMHLYVEQQMMHRLTPSVIFINPSCFPFSTILIFQIVGVLVNSEGSETPGNSRDFQTTGNSKDLKIIKNSGSFKIVGNSGSFKTVGNCGGFKTVGNDR